MDKNYCAADQMLALRLYGICIKIYRRGRKTDAVLYIYYSKKEKIYSCKIEKMKQC